MNHKMSCAIDTLFIAMVCVVSISIFYVYAVIKSCLRGWQSLSLLPTTMYTESRPFCMLLPFMIYHYTPISIWKHNLFTTDGNFSFDVMLKPCNYWDSSKLTSTVFHNAWSIYYICIYFLLKLLLKMTSRRLLMPVWVWNYWLIIGTTLKHSISDKFFFFILSIYASFNLLGRYNY